LVRLLSGIGASEGAPIFLLIRYDREVICGWTNFFVGFAANDIACDVPEGTALEKRWLTQLAILD
jgi:hypothetical protein